MLKVNWTELTKALAQLSEPDERVECELLSLLREECGSGWLEAKRAKQIDRYLELGAESPGAEAFLSGLIKPRQAVQVVLQDPASGIKLGMQDALDVLAQDV